MEGGASGFMSFVMVYIIVVSESNLGAGERVMAVIVDKRT